MVRIVYMTAEDVSQASRIAKALVQRRLAACVNIIDGMRSIYEWDGTPQEAHEVVMIAKTHEDCLPELEKMVKEMHSYDCPCILELTVSGGNTAFCDWVSSQVGPASVPDD